jgi:GntR family transcriptional regulator, arabinose operon transcriptional repressor
MPRKPDQRQHALAQIERNLDNRHWLSGALIPSERELAKLIEHSRSTTRLALVELERRGRLAQVPGKGWMVQESETSGSVAWLLTSPPEVRKPDGTIIAGIRSVLGDSGLEVIQCPSSKKDAKQFRLERAVDPDRHRIVAYFDHQALDERFVKRMRSKGVQLIGVGMPYQREYDTVAPDSTALFRQALGHLVAQGHHRIAFLGLRPLHACGELFWHRVLGYRAVAEELGLKPHEFYMEWNTFGAVVEQALRICQPTALCVSAVRHAMAIRQQLTERGLRVPEDLSLIGVGFNDDWMSSELGETGRLSRVGEPWFDIGAQVGWRAKQHLAADGPVPPCLHLIRAGAIEGASVRPIQA